MLVVIRKFEVKCPEQCCRWRRGERAVVAADKGGVGGARERKLRHQIGRPHRGHPVQRDERGRVPESEHTEFAPRRLPF